MSDEAMSGEEGVLLTAHRSWLHLMAFCSWLR